jgi:bacteriocin-like protein
MIDLKNEVREVHVDEITDNELDSVSGGFNLINTLNTILAQINLEKYRNSVAGHTIGTTLK